MSLIRKSLILVHRYLGIVLSLLFVVWFLSGIGMMYARGMPRLTPELRLERLDALDLSRVQLTAFEAAQLVDPAEPPARATLVMVMERPAYRVRGVTVFADNGEILEDIGSEQALDIAARFTRVSSEQLQHTMLTEVDQWTVGQARQLPLHKITVDDPSRTQLYIAPSSGEVVLLTTRGSRALAWVAAIPHWFYFTSLRSNGPMWYQVVLWTSAFGCVLALIGIVLGVMQFKFSRPFKLSRIPSYIPYSGWMRWHYITGLIFGVLTLTWVFSGMLSIEPWDWAAAPPLDSNELRQTFIGGPADLASFPTLDRAAWEPVLNGRVLKELEYTRIQGENYFLARTVEADGDVPQSAERTRQEYSVSSTVEPGHLLVATNPLRVRTEPFGADLLMDQVRAAYPDVAIIESAVLTDYDHYYYSRDRQAPLPVLRVKFDDPEKTWFYIDPQMSQLVGGLHRLDRVERWIYNGFHSLDFAFWYYNAPVWQFGVIVLSLGGAASSGIGLFMGIRRILRALKRILNSREASRQVSVTAKPSSGD